MEGLREERPGKSRWGIEKESNRQKELETADRERSERYVRKEKRKTE